MESKPMKNPRTSRVAVLVDTSTSWGRGIVKGVHRYGSHTARWQLFIEPRGIEQRRWLPMGWKGDGVIARVGFPELAEQLLELGVPVVNVSGIEIPGVDFPRVVTDHVKSAEMAASHLLARGFRHFGYFSLLGLNYVAGHQEAFVSALSRSGCGCSLYDAVTQLGAAEPDWNLDLNRLGAWLKSLPKPAAVLTWNASGAREVLYACGAAGLAVPEQISVISGTEDDLFCEVAPVPVTAVNLAVEEIGHHAACLLDQMIAAPRTQSPPDIQVPPLGVVERRSTDTLAIEDAALVKALQFIRGESSRVMQVEDVARHAGLCRRTLEQRFAKALGRSPAAEIRRIRIERAITMLQQTNLPVNAVAERCGFSTSEYMAAVFRRDLDVAPLHFRKHAQIHR